jgi:hypothetical protein
MFRISGDSGFGGTSICDGVHNVGQATRNEPGPGRGARGSTLLPPLHLDIRRVSQQSHHILTGDVYTRPRYAALANACRPVDYFSCICAALFHAANDLTTSTMDHNHIQFPSGIMKSHTLSVVFYISNYVKANSWKRSASISYTRLHYFSSHFSSHNICHMSDISLHLTGVIDAIPLTFPPHMHISKRRALLHSSLYPKLRLRTWYRNQLDCLFL